MKPWTHIGGNFPFPAVSPGTWCWVSDDIEVWPACFWPQSAGEWTNFDTWEDFDGEVKYYIPIEKPGRPSESEVYT